jgi:hypothetical protein
MLRSALWFLLFASGAAMAQSPCDDLAKEVDRSVREMAYSDEAPPRESLAGETSRKMDRSYEASKLSANLTIMQGNKCTMPKFSIDPRYYSDSARKCRSASPISAAAYGEIAPECDRSKWVRSTK